MKIILILLISSILALAELSNVDNDFIKFSQDYISKQTTNVRRAEETNKIMNPKIISYLQDNTFTESWYTTELEKAFEEANKILNDEINNNADTQIQQIDNDNTLDEDEKHSQIIAVNQDRNDSIEQNNDDTVKAQQSSISGFSCLCSASLNSAFKKFDKYYTNNLAELQEQLNKLKSNIKTNYKTLESNFVELDNTNVLLEDSIIEIKQSEKYTTKSNNHLY